ncbi:MAG: TolC family protein, partial [Polyangiales bacterium]
LARDPGRRALLHRARAALHAASAERALPAPSVGVEAWRVPFDQPWNYGRAQMLMLELRQSLTPAGARDGRSAAMLSEAQATLSALASRERDLAQRAALAHADWVGATMHHRVHRAHLGVLGHMLAVARARYATGAAHLADVTRVEAEQARVHRALVRYDAARARAARALEALLLTEHPLPDAPPDEALAVESARGALDELTRLALARRPEITERRARAAAADHQREAAHAEATVPMATVGGSVMVDPQMGAGYGLTAMVTLPWLSSAGRAREAEARERALAERDEARDVEARVRGEVGTAWARMRGLVDELAVLHGQSLPASRRAVAAARAAYATANAPLLSWIDAERMLLDLRMEDADLRVDLLRAVAELEGAVGVALPREPVALDDLVEVME